MRCTRRDYDRAYGSYRCRRDAHKDGLCRVHIGVDERRAQRSQAVRIAAQKLRDLADKLLDSLGEEGKESEK